MMQRFWSWLAVELGRRAGLAAVIGLLITLVLGYGVTRLEFATGQDSYLNKSDQIYKDNVKYQNLFGGQAMLGLVTMDEGHTVNELFDAAGIAQWQSLHDELSAADDRCRRFAAAYLAVATPLIAACSTPTTSPRTGVPGTDPTQAFAGQLTLRALAQEEPSSDAYNARQADSLATLQRANAVPAEQRTFGNPEWIDFLLHDNEGDIRKALARRSSSTTRHAQIIVRLPGNASIDDEGTVADAVQDADRRAPLRRRHGHRHRRAGAAQGHQRLPPRRHADPRRHRRRDHGRSSCSCCSTCGGGCCRSAVILVGVVWAFGLAGYLGIPLTLVTIAGLPVMLGVGHRLRDPDARARRGGGDHRPRAAPDPGDRPEPRPGPARRHVRRHLRLRGAALRQGADDPRTSACCSPSASR